MSAVPSDSVAMHFAIGAFWALVGAVVSRGLTLASSVLAGRLLGTTGFGEVGMIQSTQGLFGIVAGAGLGLAATKFVAESRSIDPAKAGRCATLATTIALISGTLMALVLLVLSGVIGSSVLNAPHLTVELQVATGLVLFGTINGVQTGALIGFGDFRTLAVLNSIRGVCLCVLLIAGIKLGGVLGGVIGLVLTEAIAVLANHVALRRLLPETVAWQDRNAAWSELMMMCRFGVLSLLGSICIDVGDVVCQCDAGRAARRLRLARRLQRGRTLAATAVVPPRLVLAGNPHDAQQPPRHERSQCLSPALWSQPRGQPRRRRGPVDRHHPVCFIGHGPVRRRVSRRPDDAGHPVGLVGPGGAQQPVGPDLGEQRGHHGTLRP